MTSEALERVYVWDMVVRFCHWLIVFSTIALTITGFLLAFPSLAAPGEATDRFVMGWVRQIHFLSAIVFSLSFITRIVWMFIGTRHASWKNFIPITRQRQLLIFKQARFYAWPKGEVPYRGAGHNPLAGLSYVAFYSVALVLIITGFGLYSLGDADSPTRIFAWIVPLLGGVQATRWVHHAFMWVGLLFAMVHIYIALFVGHFERNGTVESIVSGYKFIHRGDQHG